MSSHVMLDLETMGAKANSAIIAIGAVRFDEYEILDQFYRVVDLSSCLELGLELDGNTVLWWLDQDDNARTQFKNGASLTVALMQFAEWLKHGGSINDTRVWGNGASFDNVILSNAYDKAGLTRPWRFWNDRCYRTIKNLYKVSCKQEGIKHNALDDARNQARYLIEVCRYNLISHLV